MHADNWEIVGHGRGVAAHATRIGRELGFGPAALASLRLAALLHDVGKLAVSDRILRKPGALDPEEWAQIRCHPSVGARMLEAEGFEEIAGWVRAHHERPDGAGYPHGLRGDEIPIQARILAVADAYDAMVTDRPYSPALSREEAHEELRRGSGTQFDSEVVSAFLVETPEFALAGSLA